VERANEPSDGRFGRSVSDKLVLGQPANEPVPIVPKACPESVEGFNRFAQFKSFTETNTELRISVILETRDCRYLR